MAQIQAAGELLSDSGEDPDRISESSSEESDLSGTGGHLSDSGEDLD